MNTFTPGDPTYLVETGRDLRNARGLLEREGIAYTEREWQRGIVEITVAHDADVSKVFRVYA